MRADKSAIENKTPATTTGVAAESSLTTRLHVSPFDADLLKVVVPAAVLPSARNISFHTVETFPENRYGFVELLAADAEKLRNKLHGSTLRGHKMRVEKARPEQIPTPTPDDDVEKDVGKKRKKKSSDDKSGSPKRRKRDVNTIEGVLLPEGRKVKRGWTITQEEARKEKKKSKSKDKKDKKSKKAVKSKYTDKEECLMKVVLPPNAPLLADAKDSDKRKKKRKSGKSDREVVIHEFTNTTKFPSFLKLNPTPVVPKPVKSGTEDAKISTPKPQKQESRDVASSSDSSSDSSSSEDSDSSSDSEEEEDAAVDLTPQEKDGPEPLSSTDGPVEQPTAMSPSSARPKSSGSTKSLSITIPPASSPATPVPDKVHPLEALYKKPKPQDAAVGTPAPAEPFSFFGAANDDKEDEDMEDDELAPTSQLPMTPYTRQDFDQRNIRSAAPTPDTAHPRTRVFWEPNAADDLDEEDEGDEGDSLPRGSVDREDANDKEGKEDVVPAGEFHSWFYDNRRELNKSWLSRRKTARKEKRQRDNRARASRS